MTSSRTSELIDRKEDAPARVLVVDDNAPTRELVQRTLEESGMAVTTADGVASAVQCSSEAVFDVIVLDLMLPDGDGLDLCRTLRTNGNETPVLCLTARGEVADRVQGLEAGADDYLRKPFAVAELRARVRALARRGTSAPLIALEAGDSVVSFGARRFHRQGREIPLTAREWAVLEVLALRAGRVVKREALLEDIWQETSDGASVSLDVIISRLRRKLGDGGELVIHTLRGEGYRFEIRK
ncbi:MAG: response regulator transcription factor [Candidatus Eisenbacteria bacterium]